MTTPGQTAAPLKDPDSSPAAAPPPQIPSDPTETASDTSEVKPPSTMSDSLSALGSIWSGWISPTASSEAARSTGSENTINNTKADPSNTNDQVAAAAAAANEWLAGAGKMWESAVKDVGSKLKSAAEGVDTAAIGEQVEVIRQKSGRLMEDVSKSVQSINLNLDQEGLQKRAEVIGSSTRELLDRGMQTLEQGKAEALEIFVDKGDEGRGVGGKSGIAPWDIEMLPEGEKKYADELRREMLKIVVDAIYSKKKRVELFLSGVAEQEKFEFDFEEKAGMAMAALEADRNMRRLRAGLVPGKMKEEMFWKTYFFHVMRVRQTLIANEGVMPEVEGGDVDDEDPETLFGEIEEDNLDGVNIVGDDGKRQDVERKVKAKDGKRNWDDEIDAIFDEGNEE